jgi:hypothetical protein
MAGDEREVQTWQGKLRHDSGSVVGEVGSATAAVVVS